MRRLISACLVLLVLTALGCTAWAESGQISLTVSRLVLPYPGAEELIYCGTADPETVTWESSAPDVIRAENGVVTARAAGEAEITATLGSEKLQCTVSCLADSREEFDSLYDTVLCKPIRDPVASEPGTCDFFNDAGFLGDSVTYQLMYTAGREEQIGTPVPLFRQSASVKGFAEYTRNVMFRGAEWKVEDAVAESGVKKLFVMLGANDLGVRTVEETLESWKLMMSRILEKSPQVEVYIQSLIPSATGSKGANGWNDRVAAYNDVLREYAREHDMHFVEVGCYFEDSLGRLAACYSADASVHLTETAVRRWYEILRNYARQQEE